MALPFVFVLWIDAVTRHGWVEAAEDDTGVEEVWSSGYMTFRSKSEVRLASDMGTDGSRNRRIAIPIGMIRRIHSNSPDGPILFERKARSKKSNEPAS